MGDRVDLQDIFEEILGTEKAYFQPPSSLRIDYSTDVIVYHRDWGLTNFASNWPYRHVPRYQVTLISRDPDTPNRDKILALQTCVYDRFFTVDNLNHDVFKLFF